MSFSKLALALATAGWLAACAHRAPDEAGVEQLKRTLEPLRVENAAYAKQIEELENRVFILSDQLESRKVNEQKTATPQLPTVTLHPEPEAPAPEPQNSLLPADSEVEYAGEAAKSNVRRPVLKLYGEDRPVLSESAPSSEIRGPQGLREGLAASARRASRSTEMAAFPLYRRAYETLRQGKHEEASQGFREFLRQYGEHDLADNAQYWLGECAYDRKDFAAAVREFRRVVERFPHGNKVPDALLKVGYSYLALGSIEAGTQTLDQLARSYPRHEAASLAVARLAELGRSKVVRASDETAPPAAPDGSARTAHVPEEAP